MSAVLESRAGISGNATVRPAWQGNGKYPPPDDVWNASEVPDDIRVKFEALPEGVRNAFKEMPIQPDENPRTRIGIYLMVLRGHGWTLLEAIALAPGFPLGFGLLGSHSTQVFAELWAERAREEAARDPGKDLRAKLSAESWMKRDVPPVDRLLGDLLTTTTRAFIVGPTGLGKTLLGLAIGMGMAFGTGFLDWRSDRPRRVLYIDGEMPAELLIQRITDAARRIKRTDLIDNLMVLSTEEAEAIAAAFPDVGMFEALNTAEGHQFIVKLCELLKPDVIIFDNVQCLLAGVQKEEETWLGVLPLVQWLTAKRIGQLWFDHANSQARQYGSMVKSWRFDVVGLMTVLPEDQRAPRETAFLLSFDPPGKARRRTPDNWQEFAPRIIRLRDDEWTSESASNGAGGGFGSVAPSRRKFHDALVGAICRHGGTGFAELAEWQDEAQRRGLIEPPEADETSAQRGSRLRDFRKAKSDLITAGWIVVDGERVTDMKGRWE